MELGRAFFSPGQLQVEENCRRIHRYIDWHCVAENKVQIASSQPTNLMLLSYWREHLAVCWCTGMLTVTDFIQILQKYYKSPQVCCLLTFFPSIFYCSILHYRLQATHGSSQTLSNLKPIHYSAVSFVSKSKLVNIWRNYCYELGFRPPLYGTTSLVWGWKWYPFTVRQVQLSSSSVYIIR